MEPACPLCQGTRCEQVHRAVPDFEHGLPKESDFFSCLTCGLMFQWPQPTLEALASYYPVDYRPHVSGSNDGLLGFLKAIQSRLLVQKYSRWLPRDPGRRILDLGCGSGQFLKALARAGHQDLTGVDRNPRLAEAFQGTPIRFLPLQLEPDLHLEGSYQTIVLNYVIEHFLNPAQVLRRCREALDSDGQVVMLTPNSSSWGHQIFGRYWSGLHAPRHPQIFGPRALDRLAHQAGFSQPEITFINDPASWAFSFQNWMRRSHRGVARGTAWYSLALLPFWYPFATAERVAAKSSSMAVVLRR